MVSKRIVLHFPRRLVDQPIVYKLVKDFDLKFNILKANVTPLEEGLMVLELNGKKEEFHKGLERTQECGQGDTCSANRIRGNHCSLRPLLETNERTVAGG